MKAWIERGRAAAGWLSWAVVGAASAIFLLSPVLYLVTRPGAQVAPEPVRVVPPAIMAVRLESAEPIRKVGSSCGIATAPEWIQHCRTLEQYIHPVGPRRWVLEQGAKPCLIHRPREWHERIIPAFEGGRAIGFKIFPRPSGLMAALGFEPGDIIQRIGGLEVNSPDNALQAYRSASFPLRVELRRGDRKLTHTYVTIDSGRFPDLDRSN